VRRRLLELGVVRGEIITLRRAAPLGDPREYIVKGYHLSLRRREALAITVEALAAPAFPTAA
jgi:Fe2+ transport system protein FeoA